MAKLLPRAIYEILAQMQTRISNPETSSDDVLAAKISMVAVLTMSLPRTYSHIMHLAVKSRLLMVCVQSQPDRIAVDLLALYDEVTNG